MVVGNDVVDKGAFTIVKSSMVLEPDDNENANELARLAGEAGYFGVTDIQYLKMLTVLKY